MSLRFNRYWSM